ncbi:MAG TPA: hypothetical protein VFM00_11005 [Candidatus Eisenbacteria bacterium]|nr:hypothetical protein [Candidatus Eisenbacteria bacterium]
MKRGRARAARPARRGGGASAKARRASAPRRRASSDIRIFPNDPEASVGLVPATPIAPLDVDPSYVIDGRRYAPAPYDPGTLAFQYWQGETALRRTIRVWEDLFDRDFAAWHDGHPLRVRLRAGRDLNAFYDRASLQFFYDTDRVTGRAVYACESLDVVAHETGHAVLDVYQPAFWSSADPEIAAFHEAFADCSSLLVTLTEPAVRRRFLDEAGAAIRKSNLVSRLAEALGRAVYDNYGPRAVSDPTRLRDANNAFRYRPPTTLPAGASDDKLSSEPHSFSRVFTGAFYDLLAWLIARALRETPEEPEPAVERARRLGGRLLARALETLPPGAGHYRAVAQRMREVDQTEGGEVASAGIEEAFAKHGIKLPSPRPKTATVRGRIDTRAGTRGSYRSLRALDPDRAGGAAAIRAALGLPRGARLERRTWSPRVGGGVREQLIHRDHVVVRDRTLGSLSGIAVPVTCGCTLTREPDGRVEGASLRPHPHPEADEIAVWLRAWIARDAIRPKDGTLSAVEHFRARQPFRVTRAGVLERVYFD